MKDVIIVGGGLAGLSAAWRLRHTDMLLLESAERLGGRVRSERRGAHWLNWGGHVYAGGDSATSWLLDDTGVDSAEVPGSLAGLSMNGKLLTRGRVETYPFRIPMTWHDRRQMMRVGIKVRLAVARYARIQRRRTGESEARRQQRVYDFMNDRSFAEFIGELPPDAEALFAPTVTRSAAGLDQIAAGAGVGYFSLVWGIGGGLNRNILGGPSTLTGSIGAALGERAARGATVHEVVQRPRSVVVRYRQDDRDHEVEARSVVLATQAHVSHRVAVDLDRDLREALSRIVYGPFVSAAFLTDETSPRVWDRSYAIATPKRSFTVVLNMSNVLHGGATERVPGSSLMTFSPAGLARSLWTSTTPTSSAATRTTSPTSCPGSPARSPRRRCSAGPRDRPTASRVGRRSSRHSPGAAAVACSWPATTSARSTPSPRSAPGSPPPRTCAASSPPPASGPRRRSARCRTGRNFPVPELRGVLSALVTPFGPDGRIDDATLRSVVDRSVDGGVDGVVACGSTGEFAAMTAGERRHVVETVVDQTAGRVPVVAQTGGLTATEAIAHSRHAQDSGASVIMLVTPFYEPLTLAETLRYLRAVAGSVDIPVMLYNLPPATGVNLDPDTSVASPARSRTSATSRTPAATWRRRASWSATTATSCPPSSAGTASRSRRSATASPGSCAAPRTSSRPSSSRSPGRWPPTTSVAPAASGSASTR